MLDYNSGWILEQLAPVLEVDSKTSFSALAQPQAPPRIRKSVGLSYVWFSDSCLSAYKKKNMQENKIHRPNTKVFPASIYSLWPHKIRYYIFDMFVAGNKFLCISTHLRLIDQSEVTIAFEAKKES